MKAAFYIGERIVGRVLLVFVDGIGIGRPDPDVNPFAGTQVLGNFLPDDWSPPPDGGRPGSLPETIRQSPVPFGGRVRAVDASLGVPGLPQSATGQTTLFTGVNGAEVLGHHHYGFPGPRLRSVLKEHSILKRATEAGHSAAFLNAYTALFFELGDDIWKKPMSASSWNNHAAGLPFKTFDDLLAGRALFHDFTGHLARERGFDVPLRTPEEAGEVLARAGSCYDLAIYEFFMTDRVGHNGDREQAFSIAKDLESFLIGALRNLDLTTSHLVLTSDHGNMEDMSVRTHTHNPVPALVWGPEAGTLIERLARLEDFTPAILDTLGDARS